MGFLDKSSFVRDYGCLGCVWRSHGICVSPSIRDGSDLICSDYLDFLKDLSVGCSDLFMFKERLLLYIQEMECHRDYRSYSSLLSRYESLKKSDPYSAELRDIESSLEHSKLWWHRLSESVIKGLSRLNDRSSRKVSSVDVKVLDVHQLNHLLSESSKLDLLE